MLFTKRVEIKGHSAGIYSLDLDGDLLYSASADKYVARWKMKEGIQDSFSINFDYPVYAIQLVGENQFLIAGLSNGDIHVFDLKQKKEIRYFKQHIVAVFSFVENKKLNQLYASDADGNVSVWDIGNFDLLLYLPFDCGKIRRMSLNISSTYLALACQDGSIRVLDTQFFNEVKKISAHQEGVSALVFDPVHENVLISAGKDALIKKWSIDSGTLIQSIPAHNFVVYDLITLDNGRLLASASRDKTIKIFDLSNLAFKERLDFKSGGHRHSVNVLKKINEKSFISGSDDKSIIVWSS